jgi:Tfp pilus assembly protein PilO
MKVTHLQKLFWASLAGAFVSIACGVGALFLVMHQFSLRDTLSAQIAEENVKETQLLKLKKDLALVKNDQEKLNLAFVKKDQVPSFLGTVESAATARGVRLVIGALNLVELGGRTALRVDAQGSGTYSDLQSFGLALENLPYSIETGMFSLVQSNDKKGTWNANITFFLRSYVGQ